MPTLIKRFQIKTRAGRFTWLQVLCLVVSGVGYLLQNSVLMMVFVVLALVFGFLATTARVQQAKQMNPQLQRTRRRR